MPQLFGSSYTLVLIVVVVLLAALLGLAMLRRKKSGEPTAKTDKAKKTPAAKSTRESRKATAMAANAANAAEAVAAEEAATQAQVAGALAEPPDAAVAPVSAGGPSEGAVPLGPAIATEDVFSAAPATAPDSESGAPEAPATTAGGRFGRGKHAQPEPPAGVPLVAVSADPLQTIIASILGGWGDLTTEDTNRLAVFRNDKVVAALTTLELPKDLKNNEYAKTRLTQLRRYASHVEQDARSPEPAATEHEFAGLPLAATAARSAAAPAPAAPVVATAPPTAVEPAPIPTMPHEPALDPSHAFAVPKDADESWDMPAKWSDVKVTPGPKDMWGTDEEVGASEERSAEFDWGTEERHVPPLSTDLKSPALAWNAEPAEASGAEEPKEPAMVEPLGTFDPSTWDQVSLASEATPVSELPVTPSPAAAPFPQPPASEARKPDWAGGADEAHRTAEAAVAAAAAAFWGTPDAPGMEQAASTTKNDEIPAAGGTSPSPSGSAAPKSSGSPFSGLGMKVSDAADIMALPMSERADMLAFLAPAELIKVFVLAADKDLKKAVIDTLEHIGNTTALDSLRKCLEDPDPEVQLYALEAADRMLGTAP